MADVIPTRTNLDADPPVAVFLWSGIPADTNGAAISVPGFADQTVVIDGTFGGATCTLEGGNDGTNTYALTDPQGTAIAKTAAGLEQVTETPVYIQPVVTGGDGTTAINVSLMCRKVSR